MRIVSAIQTAFENHLIEDGKGSATIASYTGDIQGFIQWFRYQNYNSSYHHSRYCREKQIKIKWLSKVLVEMKK